MKKSKAILVVDPKTGTGVVLNIPGIDYFPANGSVVRILNRITQLAGRPVVLSVVVPDGSCSTITLGETHIISSPAPFRNAVVLTRKGIVYPTGSLLSVLEYGATFFTGIEAEHPRDAIKRREETALS